MQKMFEITYFVKEELDQDAQIKMRVTSAFIG